MFLLQVDPRSNSTHLMCLCNHLTFFGGNFIKGPSPIDFDKVVTELTRIDDSGNISVLVTITSVFLVYFEVLSFARRADRRDEKACQGNHQCKSDDISLSLLILDVSINLQPFYHEYLH